MCVRLHVCAKKLIGQAASMALQLCVCVIVCVCHVGCSASALGAFIKEVYMLYLHSCMCKCLMYMHVCMTPVSKADLETDSMALELIHV